jgi:hypothetical protein
MMWVSEMRHAPRGGLRHDSPLSQPLAVDFRFPVLACVKQDTEAARRLIDTQGSGGRLRSLAVQNGARFRELLASRQTAQPISDCGRG